jgi:hypothetical protein
MDSAMLSVPVNNHEIRIVSIVPMILQLMALTILLTGESLFADFDE